LSATMILSVGHQELSRFSGYWNILKTARRTASCAWRFLVVEETPVDQHVSPESVARRYAHRPGCRFVGFQEVAIAVFLMDVRVVLLKPRPVPPIDEFLLRGLSLRIDRPETLANLLGLDPRTVQNRLVELRRAEFIDVHGQPSSNEVHCVLTTKGQEVTKTLVQEEYTEDTIKVTYHGFLRRPILVTPDSLLRPQDIRETQMTPIRAIPSRYPRPDEISLDELSDVIRRLWKRRGKEKPPELISVRSVLKGVKTMYLPAVMLQYELTGGLRKQQQVAFAVDGVVDEEYERAFAACCAAEKLPEILLPSFKSTPQLVSEYVPSHIARELGNLEGVDEIVEQLEVASERIDSRTDRLESTDQPDTRQMLREELERERMEKARLERELAKRRVRRLRTFDCARLLGEALESAKERLVILSAFLSTDAVDQGFLRRLENALKRGVRVWIGYGMGKQGERQQQREVSANWSAAEAKLQSLQTRFRDQFELRDFGDTHEKILLCDKEFVVSGSYNWLSFKANPRSKKRRQEDALLVTVPEVIEKYFDEITTRFSVGP
jgi:hypothetical protein